MSKFIRIISYQPKGSLWYTDITGLNKEAIKLEFAGKIITDIGAPFIQFRAKTAKMTDYVGGIGHFTIISNRFKEILAALPDSQYMQFIPCQSNYSKASEQFWVLNLLELVDCFDWENSEYIKRTKHINPSEFWPDEVTRVEMRADKIGDRNIFRMLDSPTNIFISKYLENIILEKKLKLTLVRTPDLTQITDADPNDPRLAKWGHENID